MLIDLNRLNIENNIEFKYDVVKDEKLDKRIKDLKQAKVAGNIYISSSEEVELKCNFHGIMIIEDSISLEDISYNFNIDIEESLDNIKENYLDVYDFSKNTLDLKQILWQNIVLEVPISYSKVHDAKLKGDGWKLIDEELQNEKIDPRLEKLEELLERRD